MKAAPAAPLIVTKPEFLLEVLVVPLDPPAQLGGVDQGAATDGGGQRRQPVLRRFGFIRGPFDQAPFLGTRRGTLIIAMRKRDPHGGEARSEPGFGALAPTHPPPVFFLQTECPLLGGD